MTAIMAKAKAEPRTKIKAIYQSSPFTRHLTLTLQLMPSGSMPAAVQSAKTSEISFVMFGNVEETRSWCPATELVKFRGD